MEQEGKLLCAVPAALNEGRAPAQVREEDVLAVAAALEVGSDHPIANAVVAHAQSVLAPQLPPRAAAAQQKGSAAPCSPKGGSARQLEWVWPTSSERVVHGAPCHRPWPPPSSGPTSPLHCTAQLPQSSGWGINLPALTKFSGNILKVEEPYQFEPEFS